MRSLSIAVIASASAIALTQIASAADLPRKAPAYTPPPLPPAFTWTGCYIGAHAGGGWGDKTISVPSLLPGVSATGLGCVKTRRRSIAMEEVTRPRPFSSLTRKWIQL